MEDNRKTPMKNMALKVFMSVGIDSKQAEELLEKPDSVLRKAVREFVPYVPNSGNKGQPVYARR